MFQARLVAERMATTGHSAPEIIVIKTSGDHLQDAPLSEIGGKRLFVKEIEDALLNGDIDLAVHSSKDMPAVLPDGLEVGAVLEREDPRDALVLPKGDGNLFPGSEWKKVPVPFSARIGTGSVRRIAQLKPLFERASFENVRGNLDTRLRKLDSGDYDLLVLAAAGLRRLGFTSRISATVPVEDCIPAPGQGIIAVEMRNQDERTRKILATINHIDAASALDAERAVVTALGGGCHMPIGAIALPTAPDRLELHAVVASLDGSRIIRYKKVGTTASAGLLGREVAEELLRRGAAQILGEVRQDPSLVPNPNSVRLT